VVRHAATTMIKVTRTNVEAELCQSCTDFKDASMYHCDHVCRISFHI